MNVVELIDAIGRLALIALGGWLLWNLRRPLTALLERKGSEVSAFGVTIKVGEKEVPVQNATDELRRDLNDLQNKMTELLKAGPPGSAERPGPPTRHESEDVMAGAPGGKRVLWVDDVPANNAAFTKRLKDAGLAVTEVRTTAEALQALNKDQFDLVISDLGRTENGTFKALAGLDLTREIRRLGLTLPVVVFSSSGMMNLAKDQMREAGVTFWTASPLELMNYLSVG
jgi:CheY-like chemotaxis protein